MVVVRSPVRSCVRSVVRDVFGVVDGQTDLQRILALSPSLLVWPANGAGWQGTSGGTLAASGQPLGLGVDLSQLGGKTLSEWLATATELVTNGTFVSNVDGWTEAVGGGATLTWSAGKALLTGGASGGRGYQVISTVVGRTYVLNMERVGGAAASSGYRVTTDATGGPTGQIVAEIAIAGNWSRTVVFVATATSTTIAFLSSIISGTNEFDNISVKELPGNHLRAGTWASPSDAARGTLQVSGGATWIDPDATSDAYSFLTALSARAIVARVRVPTGYSNADRFLTNDAETVNVSADAGSWTNTGSGSTRINGASGAAFTVDTWQTLTIEWGSGQAFTRMFFSATGTLFGSMDVASLAVFNSALTSGDRAIAEAVIGATA